VRGGQGVPLDLAGLAVAGAILVLLFRPAGRGTDLTSDPDAVAGQATS